MARPRVHELAKTLGVESSRVLEILRGLGSDAANHMSTVTDEEARGVRAALTREALLRHQRRTVGGQSPASAQQAKGPAAAQRARAVVAPPPVQKARSVATAIPAPAPTPPPRETARPAAERISARAVPPSEVVFEPQPAAATAAGVTAAGPQAATQPRMRPEAGMAAGGGGAAAPAQRPAPASRPRAAGPAGQVAAVGGPAGPVPRPARPPGAVDDRRPGGPPRPGGAGGARPGAPRPGGGARPGGPPRPGARPGAPRPGGAGRPGAPGRPGGAGGARPGARRPFRKRGGRRATAEQIEARRGPVVPATVLIDGPMTVKELASRAGLPMAAAVKILMGMGIMATVNQILDVDIARRVAAELGATVEEPEKAEEEHPERLAVQEKSSKLLRGRAPVVTVMGHVDHGKTTLLDAIRHSNVAASEAGGITQHIGASVVNWQGHRIVFIDTPGHEAFTAMRARGAQVTDLVILVVAADDGVKPQTLEAISHIRAAGVPMIVAVNKIDRPGADPDRVKRQLSEAGVTAEDWGGDTVFVNVSALQATGIDTLLEMIILISEMQDLRANPARSARGTVVEAKLDRGRGPVATVLVQTGTLRVGDAIYAGPSVGRVRALFDHLGKRLDQAGPSMPVEVLGLSEVPTAGDPFEVAEDEKIAREKAGEALAERRGGGDQAGRPNVSLEDLYSKLKAGETKDLNLVLKSDVQGSLEALRSTLGNLSLPEVRIGIIHTGVGAITQDDVMLASASDAIVIGFGVRPDPNARRVAQRERVDIRSYQIIYEIVDDIVAAAKGMLAPKTERVLSGKAQVRAVFQVPRQGAIAGCYVTEGKMVRNAEVRVVRDGKVIHEGKVDSLKRFKDDAREVAAGFECGLGIDGFNDIVEGDVIEAWITQTVERSG